MTSNRPYLIRALHQWISDNGLTPYLLVDAVRAQVDVPPSAINDGRVVLNIAYRAVAGLELGDEYISFSARFGGVSRNIVVPVSTVLAIYCHENGQGMAMPEEPEMDQDAASQDDQASKGAHLSAVSSDGERDGHDASESSGEPVRTLRSVPSEPASVEPNQSKDKPSGDPKGNDNDGDDEPSPPTGGQPTLRVVK